MVQSNPTFTWQDCLPDPTGPRQAVCARLDPDLVAEIDLFREQKRWEWPWLTASRSAFVETAVRFLLKTLKTSPIGVF